jgi:predicted porin
VAGGEETNMQVGARYKIGMFDIGLAYNKLEGETPTGANLEKDSINLAVVYDMPGPGRIMAGYTVAGEFEGTLAAGTADTGASLLQIGYLHNLSKRTMVGLIVARLDNDDQGTYNFTNLAQGPGEVLPGESGSVVVLRMVHTF